jgi:hypothetical protein
LGLGEYYWGEKVRGWGKWTAWDATHVHIYSSCEIASFVKAFGFVLDRVTGYHYEGTLPFIGRYRLPLEKSARFPISWMGFNVMLECHKG